MLHKKFNLKSTIFLLFLPILQSYASNQQITQYQINSFQDNIQQIAFSSDDKTLAITGYKVIEIWDVTTQKLHNIINTSENDSFYISSISFHPNGNIIAIPNEQNSIKIWDIRQDKQIAILKGATKTELQVHKKNIFLAKKASIKNKVPYIKKPNKLGHISPIGALAYSPDGKILASGSWNGVIKLWDTQTNLVKKTFELPKYLIHQTSLINTIDFNPSGKVLAIGYDNGNIFLWDIKTENIIVLKKHQKAIIQVKFSPNGEFLASSAKDNSLKLWKINSDNGTIIANLNYHKSGISSITFSKDSAVLISAGQNKIINFWSIPDSKIIYSITGHKSAIKAISLNKNGRILSSATADGVVKLWDLSPFNMSDAEISYYSSLDDKKQRAFYGLDDKSFNHIFTLNNQEKNSLWLINNQKERIKFIALNKEKRLWHEVISKAEHDMTQILSEDFPLITNPPEKPYAKIPPFIKQPILPKIKLIKAIDNETKNGFNNRMRQIRAERKNQLKLIAKQFAADVNNRNKKTRLIEKKYLTNYRNYLKNMATFIKTTQKAINHHAKKLYLRNRPAYKQKKEAEVIETRFYEIFGNEHLVPSGTWSNSYSPNDKTISAVLYWGDNLKKSYKKLELYFEVYEMDKNEIRGFFKALNAGKIKTKVKLNFKNKQFFVKSISVQYQGAIYQGKLSNVKPVDITLTYPQQKPRKPFKVPVISKNRHYNFILQDAKINDYALKKLITKEAQLFKIKQ